MFVFQSCSPPALVLSLSPGLGPDGLPSPGSYPHRRTLAANGNGSCAGSPPPYPGSVTISHQTQRHPRERGSVGSNNGMSTVTTERTRPNSRGANRNSPFGNEFLAAAMRSNSERSSINATLISPIIRPSINEEQDIKRELDSPTPKRQRISVSSQELLDQLSVVREGARRLVTGTGAFTALEQSSASSRPASVHPPTTRSPVSGRGPIRTVILNSGGGNSRWNSIGNDRSNARHNEAGSYGSYQNNATERGSNRAVHTRRSPHNSHHHSFHSYRDHHHSVRRSPNHYHNYHNQHHDRMINRRNTRQRERERERNRAAAIAAARAVAANLQDSYQDLINEEVSCIILILGPDWRTTNND